MLKEKIRYDQNLPFHIMAAYVEEYPIHFHDEMEIIYVLEGSIYLRDVNTDYTLSQGDVYIINEREIHSLMHTQSTNQVMLLHLDQVYLARYYENLKNNFFVTDPENEDDESIEALRTILAQILMEQTRRRIGYERSVMELIHALVRCLLSDFHYFKLTDSGFKNAVAQRGNKVLAGRLKRITDYMYDNYSSRLTLSEVAEREHLSTYYLSHAIRAATGLSFQELLAYIRVEESERLLLGGKKRLSEISDRVGFSAVRYYVKGFEKWYGMHPEEYRRIYAGYSLHHGVGAVLRELTGEQIEHSVRFLQREIYRQYADVPRRQLSIIELPGADRVKVSPTDYLGQSLSKCRQEWLAEPYQRLLQLRERVVASGDNYLITQRQEGAENRRGFSILLYGISTAEWKQLHQAETEEEWKQIAAQTVVNLEFLVSGEGFCGAYRILRCHMDEKYFLSKIKSSAEEAAAGDARSTLLSELYAQGSRREEIRTLKNVLQLQSSFPKIGAELILIDPVSDIP